MSALNLALKEPVQMVCLISKFLYIYQKMGMHFCISIITSALGPKTEFLELRPSKRSKENYQGDCFIPTLWFLLERERYAVQN